MQEEKIQAIGMAWFEKDDDEAFRLVLPDRAWHATFAQWESAAQQGIKRLQHQGLRAIKAKVQSVDFVAWCRATGRNIDTKALTAFANEAARRAIKGQH